MKKKLLFFFILDFYSFYLDAQIFVEPVIGCQVDVNNKPGMKQWNTGLQFAFVKNKSEFLIILQKSHPVSSASFDSSFTTNLALPLYNPVQKQISPSSFSFALSWRKPIIGSREKQHLSLLTSAGISRQKISVAYNYDKNNYTILNPDKTLKATGLILAIGTEYMLPVKTGRFFLQIIITSPPLGIEINYPSSFRYIAPLSFNAGYSIEIKKHHEKK